MASRSSSSWASTSCCTPWKARTVAIRLVISSTGTVFEPSIAPWTSRPVAGRGTSLLA